MKLAWVEDISYYDLKKSETLEKKTAKLAKPLFGPSMTKPKRTANNDIIFFIAGGDVSSDKTVIYKYFES